MKGFRTPLLSPVNSADLKVLFLVKSMGEKEYCITIDARRSREGFAECLLMENAANNCTLHTRLAAVLASRKPDITASAQISPFLPLGALFFRHKLGVSMYDAVLPASPTTRNRHNFCCRKLPLNVHDEYVV